YWWFCRTRRVRGLLVVLPRAARTRLLLFLLLLRAALGAVARRVPAVLLLALLFLALLRLAVEGRLARVVGLLALDLALLVERMIVAAQVLVIGRAAFAACNAILVGSLAPHAASCAAGCRHEVHEPCRRPRAARCLTRARAAQNAWPKRR